MKFNTKKTSKTTNHEGAEAYQIRKDLELYTTVVTATLSDKFYEKGGERLERIRKLIQENDPAFVAKLAVYAREQMNLRSIPLVLAVELAKVHSGDSLVGQMVSRIVKRADEITELLAYYQLSNQRQGIKKLDKLSKQIQKGLAVAFNSFDAYQFAKYNRAAEVKLRDALFLVHLKAKDKAQQAIFDKIVADNLEVPYTWEVELSTLGQRGFASPEEKAAAFTAKWEELIESQKIGYMAMLRNLRNILEAKVSAAHLQKVCDYLSNPKAVLNSKQFPFRFLAAYRELKDVQSMQTIQILNALEQAVQISAGNIEGFGADTKVVLACDVSGSMQRPVSARSKILSYDIGLMLAMLLQFRCKQVVSGMFGNTWKIINVPQQSILSNVNEFYKREGEVGYSTNGYLVIKDLLTRRVAADKVMLFTDCQLWNSNQTGETIANYWAKYKQMYPEAKLYLFDLAGYGNTPLSIEQGGVHLISGWSDKVFGVLKALEEGKDAIQWIDNQVVFQ